MKIKDVMSEDVEIVSPETSISEIAKKMAQRDCGCVIVAKNDRLVGVVTDRDIALRCVAKGQDPQKATAEQVMSPKILYCREQDDADAIVKNMGQNAVRRLPVVNADKRLVGIVSLGDLAASANAQLCGQTLGDICRSSNRAAA